MNDQSSLYKSRQGYSAMMDAYDRQLARYPVPYESRYVPTRHGETHVLVSGRADAPPLILLHGLAVNALTWLPNIAALSPHFRTYALDNIGDAGRSAPSRPPLHSPAYGEWLVDVFDELNISQANIMGISLGGWLTLKVACYAPERVRKIVPLCPAGFVPVRWGFLSVAARASLFPNEATLGDLARCLCAPTVPMSEENAEFLRLAMRHHRRKDVPVLRLLSDSDLSCITAETLLLVGEYESIYNPQAMVARARHSIPHVTAEIIADAGHALNSDQPDALHERVLAFLGAAEAIAV